ncbi:MAG: succinate dehydrogenase cytochrome b subunit [Cytophagaceae bacterium]|nr:MAG: succinate dehydrogenase cytochrome b subunit [Cytophagaceae bacterium]
MGWVIRFAKSSVGAKLLMALTGLVLVGFVLGHMVGNLQVYLGPDVYNGYAAFLKSVPELLWPVRLFLLASVVLHIVSGIRLARINRAARPEAYHFKKYTRASFTSRTMLISGLVVLSFLIYHLLHFTLGKTDPMHFHLLDDKGRHDVYSMFVFSFQNVYVSVSYIVAMVLLGLHLNHGVSSLFQSLGINHPRFNGLLNKVGPIFSLVIVLGNISMPISVLMGWLTLPAGVV